MKRISVIIALLIAGGVGVLSGVALAQQTNWIALLVEEYSRVWKAAYDETAKHGLPPAGREAVAERVLDAYIAGRVDGVAALPTSTPTPIATSTATPTPSRTPTPLPSDSGSSFGLSRSDIDGYSSGYEIVINTTGQLRMSVGNIHTSGGEWVALSRGGTLTTDVGTVMEDRYEYSCSVGGGVLWDKTTYASDKHNVDLPKTYLNTARLWDHPTTTLGMQICAGEQPPPDSRIVVRFDGTSDGEVGVVEEDPTSTPTPTSTSTPSPTPTPLPSDSGNSSGLSRSDIDGFISEYSIEITTNGQLLMYARNLHTSGGSKVLLTRDGKTLTTGDDGSTLMEDRYLASCIVDGGWLWKTTTYAADEYNVDLPKTELNTAPLLEHPTTTLGMQICDGEQPPPDSHIVVDF